MSHKIVLLVALICSYSHGNVVNVCDFLRQESLHEAYFDQVVEQLGLSQPVNQSTILTDNPYELFAACGFETVLLASQSQFSSVAWREFISNISMHLKPDKGGSADVDDLCLIQYTLSLRAGPFEKGDYLRRIMEFDPSSNIATKNFVSWAEQRDLYDDAERVLQQAIIDSSNNHREEDDGLELFHACLCPPHFKSKEHATYLFKKIIKNLDLFIKKRLSRAAGIKQNNDKVVSENSVFNTLTTSLRNMLSLSSQFDTVDRNDDIETSKSVVALSTKPRKVYYDGSSALRSPLRAVGSLPFAWPYLGEKIAADNAIKKLNERLSFSYRLMSPSIASFVAPHLISAQTNPTSASATSKSSSGDNSAGGSSSDNDEKKTSRRSTSVTSTLIRLGVVAEAQGNTSPGELIGGIMEKLPMEDFHITWFQLEGLATRFNEVMCARAQQVVVISEKGQKECPVALARTLISKAKVDVLLYLAIGLTPITFLLAQSRLAPVQVVFGHGHPITSGSKDSIDYFVSSLLFEPPVAMSLKNHVVPLTDVSESKDNYIGIHKGSGTGGDYENIIGVELSRDNSLLGTSGECYTEQLVLFDSMSVSLSKVAHHRRLSRHQLEQELNLEGFFSHLHNRFSGFSNKHILDINESGKDDTLIDGQNHSFKGGQMPKRSYHVYSLLQHSKKVHPNMDVALKTILSQDKNGLIIVLDGSRAHFSRWKRNKFLDDELARIRFLPRLPHSALLSVLGACDVFLDPFPWGAGITSAESFQLDVPVVTVPSEIRVLQLALGQYRTMGLESNFLVARNVSHYAQLALRVGQDRVFRTFVRESIKSRKHLLMEPDRNEFDALAEWVRFLKLAAKTFTVD